MRPVVLTTVAVSLACGQVVRDPVIVTPQSSPSHSSYALPAETQNVEPLPVQHAQSVPLARSRDPWRANEDPSDNFVVAPPDVIPDCETRLADAGITWRPTTLRVRPSPNGKITCGSPQVVIYDRGPTGMKWNAAPVVTCGLAIALARFESVVQEEAQRAFGLRVVRIRQGGTYSCRRMARYNWVSEHSYANAIDLYAFTLSNQKVISVERHFGKTSEAPTTTEAKFLRTLASRLYDEGVFSNVLTPYLDALHRNHFHVDLARYRNDGTRGEWQ